MRRDPMSIASDDYLRTSDITRPNATPKRRKSYSTDSEERTVLISGP